MLAIAVLNFCDSGIKFICFDSIMCWDLPICLQLLSLHTNLSTLFSYFLLAAESAVACSSSGCV